MHGKCPARPRNQSHPVKLPGSFDSAASLREATTPLRACDFFVCLIVAQSYKGSMSHCEEEITREARETKPAVRLRVAERRQIAMVGQCPDDLGGAEHPVRVVMGLVGRLDVSRFAEPIKAREGVAGGDATGPR